MLKQTVLQVQAQKLNVPAVELAIERSRAAVHQRLQVSIIVQGTGDAFLFKLRFQRRGKMMVNELRAQAQARRSACSRHKRWSSAAPSIR